MPRAKKQVDEIPLTPKPVLAMQVTSSAIKVRMDENTEMPLYHIGWVLSGRYTPEQESPEVQVNEYTADLLLIRSGLKLEAVEDGYIIRDYIPVLKNQRLSNLVQWIPDPTYFRCTWKEDATGVKYVVTCELTKRNGMSDDQIEMIKQANNLLMTHRTPAGG